MGIRGCDTPSVLDMDDAATVAGGVGDTYGKDCTIEDQLVTSFSGQHASILTSVID
jgi:malate dehydrogenase (oxaloacetate-decarboxylating)(NADP+)